MSEMKKFFSPMQINEEQKRYHDEIVAENRKDPLCARLIEQKGVPSEVLEEDAMAVRAWRNEVNECEECRGLNYCSKNRTGYFNDLQYDGILKNVLTACKYLKVKQESEKHLSRFLINQMPPRFNAVSFKTTRWTDENKEYNTVVMEVAALFNAKEGLYLFGKIGTGKTYLAACAANGYAKDNKSVCFVYYPEFVRQMASMIKTGEYKNYVDKMIYADFVVFDDIGAESVTEWNRDTILLPILNSRYENGKTTWFTSNVDLETLQLHYSITNHGPEDPVKAMRIVERISVMTKMKTLPGEDRRKEC